MIAQICLAFSENLNFTDPISIALFYGQPQILLSKEMDFFRNFSGRNELQNGDIKLPNFKPKNVIDEKSSENFI